MLARFVGMVVLGSSVLAWQPASAGWSAFAPAGAASLSSDPSCAATFDGILLCGSQDSLGRPVISNYNSNFPKWSAWTLLDSAGFSPVGCALTGDAAALTCAYLEPMAEEVATW